METRTGLKTDIPERRSTPRIPYRTTAICTSPAFNGAGTIKDLSSDGLFLETPIPLIVGDQVHIVFELRNSKRPMDISGKIARRTPGGVGVRFLWN